MDLSGSTALKESLSLGRLHTHATRVQEIVRSAGGSTTALGAIVGNMHASREDYYWVKVQLGIFNDFHTEFAGATDANFGEAWEGYPWKYLGDELIYSIAVSNPEEASSHTKRFLRTIRRADTKLAEGHRLRLKGTAWVAGFPVRSTRVQ